MKVVINMIYRCLRALLFLTQPELAHHIVLTTLKFIPRCFFPKAIYLPRQVMGLSFPNPVGLAAGLDKNADYIDAAAKLGFGFIEVGTVTSRPQKGNPKPRLFRLTEAEALINRMGFNNKGVAHLVKKLKQRRYTGILGVNIGKNRDTPLANAYEDYLHCFKKVYPYADYVTINISSPNTPDLRHLQYGDYLEKLLTVLKDEQQALTKQHNKYVPLAIKIAPDLTESDIQHIAKLCLSLQIDAIIATNTAIARDGVKGLSHADEAGGLSGAPLAKRANQVIAQLHQILADKIPIIGVGGIMSIEDAQAKLTAGASLLQLYTGLIYRGPGLVREICCILE